jgi:limonene-1,2-epoxide hydrolase
MSSISPLPSRRSTSVLMTARMSSLRRCERCRRVEVETHVHLDAADGREVVALRIEEQRVEHGFGDSMVGGSPGRMTR